MTTLFIKVYLKYYYYNDHLCIFVLGMFTTLILDGTIGPKQNEQIERDWLLQQYPKFYLILNTLGGALNKNVQTFPPIILIYRRGNFVSNWECKLIYRQFYDS